MEFGLIEIKVFGQCTSLQGVFFDYGFGFLVFRIGGFSEFWGFYSVVGGRGRLSCQVKEKKDGEQERQEGMLGRDREVVQLGVIQLVFVLYFGFVGFGFFRFFIVVGWIQFVLFDVVIEVFGALVQQVLRFSSFGFRFVEFFGKRQ